MEESDRVAVAVATTGFPAVGREGAVEISDLRLRYFGRIGFKVLIDSPDAPLEQAYLIYKLGGLLGDCGEKAGSPCTKT